MLEGMNYMSQVGEHDRWMNLWLAEEFQHTFRSLPQYPPSPPACLTPSSSTLDSWPTRLMLQRSDLVSSNQLKKVVLCSEALFGRKQSIGKDHPDQESDHFDYLVREGLQDYRWLLCSLAGLISYHNFDTLLDVDCGPDKQLRRQIWVKIWFLGIIVEIFKFYKIMGK